MGAIAGNTGAIIGIVFGVGAFLFFLGRAATSDYVAVEQSTTEGTEDDNRSGGTRRRKKRKGTHRR